MTNATRLTKRIRAKSLNRILIPSLMHDIRKLEKCNGPVKVLITSCKSEQLWQAMSGRVNGKVQYCQLWELLLKRINSLFILRFPSLISLSLTALRRANSSSSWTCWTRTSCRTCREKAWSCSAASTNHWSTVLGSTSKTRAVPRMPQPSARHAMTRTDEVDGGMLAMQERAEGLEIG